MTLDRLGDGQAVQVILMQDAAVGDRPVRAPHRHDYHELIWLRAGCGEHLIDGLPHPMQAGTITVIGRGQVHQFLGAGGMDGAILRFGDELLAGGTQRLTAGWLLTCTAGRTIAVPAGEQDRLEALIQGIHAEGQRPKDTYSAELERSLLATVLLLMERWYDGSRAERREADDAEIQVHRRFTARLEQDYPRHHDAGYYADALAMPRAALSRLLVQLTGRTTKDLILDRVMLEAARLLRFTDLTIGEIAYQVGFSDQMYFSRAFKRHFGRPPKSYRDALRGAD
ncbi:MAG: transcriptional regulator, AraC family [Solirubrobacterales bacterium]|nr:transcriptional regulator, AraC family [Solirubrobacterales bacterium]